MHHQPPLATHNNNPPKKSLLNRLAEACNRHKELHHQKQDKQRRRKRHADASESHDSNNVGYSEKNDQHEQDYDDDDDDEEIEKEFEQCTQDLKILKNIIPRVEHDYRLPKHRRSCLAHSPSAIHQRQSQIGTDSANATDIHEHDISNLCMFYHSLVIGSFCPHSKQILLQSGADGIDVFPRIYELFRYLASDIIVNNTITSLSSTTPSSSTTLLLADQLSVTSCIMLNSVTSGPSTCHPNDNHVNCNDMNQIIIRDLILLLFDLSAIFASNILSSLDYDCEEDYDNEDKLERGEEDQPMIELLTFGNVIATKSSSTKNKNNMPISTDENDMIQAPVANEDTEEYAIEIGSLNGLLSLQRGIYHIIFQFIIISDKNMDGVEAFDCPMASSYSYYAPFLKKSDLRSLIIASIRQVLEMKVSMENGLSMFNEYGVNESSSVTTVLLSLRNKVMASNLLLLLLPDFSSIADEQDVGMSTNYTVSSPIWFELSSLVVNSIISHYEFMRSTLIPLMKEYHQKKKRCTKLQEDIYSPIQDLSTSLSSILGFLLINIYICPMKPYHPNEYQMWSLRSKLVCSLLDCIPHIDYLFDEIDDSSSSLSKSVQEFSIVTLRAIHISLVPGPVAAKDDNSHGDFEDLQAMNESIGNWANEVVLMRLVICNHCSVRKIYSSMFNLLQNLSITTIVVSIIGQMVIGSCDQESSAVQGILSHICESTRGTLHQMEYGRNKKRRKLDDKWADDKIQRVDGKDWLSSSMLSAMSIFLNSAVEDSYQTTKAMKSHDDVLQINPVEVTKIMSAIRMIHYLIGFDSCCPVQEKKWFEESFDSNIKSTLSELNNTAILVSKCINSALNSDHVSSDCYDMITTILEAFLCVVEYTPSLVQLEKKDIVPDHVKNLISSISTTCLSYTFTSEPQHRNLAPFDTEIDMSKSPFDFNVVKLLHTDHLKELNGVFSSCQQGYYKLCSRLMTYLGVSLVKEIPCLYGLDEQISSVRNLNRNLLVELVCTTQQRCILFCSLQPSHSRESIQHEGSDMDLLHNIPKSIHLESAGITTFVSVIPYYIYSMMLKSMALISQTERGQTHLVRDFVDLLRKTKYEDMLVALLEKPKENDEKLNETTFLNILEGVKRSVLIYTYLPNLSELGDKEIDKNMKDLNDNKFQADWCKDFYNQAHAAQISSHANTFETCHHYFSEFLVNVLKKIVQICCLKCFSVQKSLFHLLTMICHVIPTAKLKDLSVPTECIPLEQQGDENDMNESITLLKLLLQKPFGDEDEGMRLYCAEMIGPFLFSNQYKIFNALYRHVKDDHQVVDAFYRDIDDLLSKHCGVMQSEFSNTLRSSSHSISTSNSTWSTEIEKEMIVKSSRLISSIHAISSICLSADKTTVKGKLITEKGVLRLVRMWATLPDDCLDLSTANRNNNEKVCFAAFYELLKLNLLGVFNQRMVDNSDSSFMPILFGELLSQGIIQEKIHGRNKAYYQNHYKMVTKMIKTFLLQRSSSVQDSLDSFCSTLDYVDRMLPDIITGLVLGLDIDTLYACTGFRLHLLAELKKMKKREKFQSNEQILGSQSFKLRKFQVKKSFNPKDLSEQTAMLCQTDKDIKVLSKLLPALLMEPSKAPTLFYLKTVLQSQASFTDLIQANELKIIEGLFWEVGIDADFERCYSSPQSWLLANSASPAVQGLKKGAIIISKLNVAVEPQSAIEESVREGLNSFDCNGSNIQQSNILENWIQKHFMMLLVKCVTIRWKRGKIETKTRAMKCLKILICFLRPSESSQYVTQILTMIDAVMNLKTESSNDILAKRKLQLIAVQCLSNFVRILVLDSLQTVGENLSKVIASVFPLFDEDSNPQSDGEEYDATSKCHVSNDILLNTATTCVVDMLEMLTEGDNGKELAPFFAELPFLPSHPKLNQIKDVLKRYNLNFDSIAQITAADCSENTVQTKDTLTNTSSSSNHKSNSINSKMQDILRKRLQCLKRLFNHESDNVRKLVLKHSIRLISENRELFYNLVKTEDASLQFLTIRSSQANGKEDENRAYNDKSMKSFFDQLLLRCTLETDTDIRMLLSKCLGEIGAIDPKYFGDGLNHKQTSFHRNIWVIENGAPWKGKSVKEHYELQLVTKHFVKALKAAPTPTDQHKIGFGIQEVLKMLDKCASTMSGNDENESSWVEDGDKRDMNPWLRDKLVKAEVLSLIEPFWSSRYTQQEASKLKTPPFFRRSTSYYTWLSTWGRFMIEKSQDHSRSMFRDLFYACRSAIRTEAGVGILEFLLPLLLLNNICFGDANDRNDILKELREVLSYCDEDTKRLDKIEMQKSVAVVFNVIETFQRWVDNEIEEKHSKQRSLRTHSTKQSRMSRENSSSIWSSDDSVDLIEELLKQIPLDLCAKAAYHVGMYAQSLQYLEIEARKRNAHSMYELTSQENEKESMKEQSLPLRSYEGVDLTLAHILFGELNDYGSMKSISRRRKRQDIIECIREKEAAADYTDVLALCEQATQGYWLQNTNNGMAEVNIGVNNTGVGFLGTSNVNALLELGHIGGALNYVKGKVAQLRRGGGCNTSSEILIPYGVEASWRLGQWDDLEELISPYTKEKHWNETAKSLFDLDGQYKIAIGQTMFALKKKNKVGVAAAIKCAREAIIPTLSVAAGENYIRAFPYLLKLHCLREIEEASKILLENSTSEKTDQFSVQTNGSWSWNSRLDTIGSNTSALLHVTNTRLALTRLSNNYVIEAALWLNAGKQARKGGLYQVAQNCLSHAENMYRQLQMSNFSHSVNTIDVSEVKMQLAKMNHALGNSTEALLMVKQDHFDRLLHAKTDSALREGIEEMKLAGTLEYFCRSALQATEWMVESGLKSGSEVTARYKLLTRISPEWERAHYKFARYLNSVLDSRIDVLSTQNNRNIEDDNVRAEIILKDSICQKYIILTMKQYGDALSASQKHVFQALPRYLSLWFDFTAIGTENNPNQDTANQIVAEYIKKIPSVSYYSVLPQLISRIAHEDEDTAEIVHAIIKRVLVKYPAQALWNLGWLRHSVHKDRQKIGEDIFKGAQKSLRRHEEMRMHDLLEGSKTLFTFLIDLAKHTPQKIDHKHCFYVKPWKGPVHLKEFVPPVQAALTISRNALGIAASSEAFPKSVPRMRAFSTNVNVMASKAKPKKLTAYAIPDGFDTRETTSRSTNKRLDGDIGEMHFLVKQEVRGDLRKDARVQDLNNVINRLFSGQLSSKQSNGRRQRRRLRLRTFAVTCLSEDCGILEWVPQTNSLRNLIASSFHPHASHNSAKRRGRRMTDFSNRNLRDGFAHCQDMYLKHGHLTKAAKTFKEIFLKEYPPLFYWWFIHQFQDPHQWFEARTKFALSSAAWSAVGHVIGLGDRHSENILVDTSSGECVHVDFDCIFDKGLHLPRPEIVPFRLTPNMIDAFGPTGADGTFTGGLAASMRTLRDNKDVLLSVLEPFLKDPVIDWKKQRTQQKQGSSNSPRASNEAKRSIRVIEQRLKGMYNLRNPNWKNVKRVDGTFHEDDEVARLLPLSVEGQVHKMVTEASSHENLIQLYVGWMPWL